MSQKTTLSPWIKIGLIAIFIAATGAYFYTGSQVRHPSAVEDSSQAPTPSPAESPVAEVVSNSPADSSAETSAPAPAPEVEITKPVPRVLPAEIISPKYVVQEKKTEVVQDGDVPPPHEPVDFQNQMVTEAAVLMTRAYVAFGIGMDYLRFSQAGSEANVDYASLFGPSFSVYAGMEWSHGWGFDVSLANYPGKVNGGDLEVVNANFNWQALSLEARYKTSENFGLRFGVQRHTLPYVLVLSESAVEVKSHEMTMLTLGADAKYSLSENLEAEFLLRYQLPIAQSSNSDQLSFKPKMAFDGSSGLNYKVNDRFKIGAFWYGQWHEYKYSMQNAGTLDEGSNKFFFSNVETRLEYSF